MTNLKYRHVTTKWLKKDKQKDIYSEKYLSTILRYIWKLKIKAKEVKDGRGFRVGARNCDTGS